MDFETAFAHYQSNTATAEETALVERELAKYQLIEDYFAARELPELPEDTALAASETKAVKRRLGRRTWNTVLMAAAAMLAVLLLLQFAVSPLLNRRVYGGADDHTDFDAAMTSLTGLYMPLGVYVGSSLSHTGFMTDTVSLQFSDLTGSTRFGVRTGLTLRLGALGRLSASDLLPLHYALIGYFTPTLNADGTEAAPTDYCRQALADMSDQLTVTAAVRFTDRLSSDELAALMARHPELTFLSGKVGNEGVYTPQSLFCSLTPAGISFGDALEADYPGFTLPHTNITGAALRQHFEAMLQCLIDHPSVAKAASMMGNEAHNYKSLLQDVQDNGLQFTGVWVQGTPSALLSLMDESSARSISNYEAHIRLANYDA